MRVVVEPYQPLWAEQFQAIKTKLAEILQTVEYKGIEHVGSTSVPGLAAKPVLDIDIIIVRKDLDAAAKRLVTAGYQYLGDRGIPDRYALKSPEQYPAQNIYLCIENSLQLKAHLMLREVCRQDKTMRDRYGELKLQLSTQEWSSVDEYCVAKNEIIESILLHGGLSATEHDEIRAVNTLPAGTSLTPVAIAEHGSQGKK